MNMNEFYELVIFDPETSQNYEPNLNLGDYTKAQQDEEYLTLLLRHAKKELEPTEEQQSTQESNENQTSNQKLSVAEAETEGREAYKDKKSIKVWTYNECKALIRSMAVHYNDLNHPKKRKHVFESVANDLLSEGYDVNAVCIQNKWKSLIRSYRKCKDTKTRTGQSPSRFLFFEEMDEIVGHKPTNECKHSLNSTFNSTPVATEAEPEVNVLIENVHSPPLELHSSNSTSSKHLISTGEDFQGKENIVRNKTSKKQDNKTLRFMYMERKIKEYDNREIRHKEKLQMEERRLELENKKLEILAKFLDRNDK